MSSSHEQFHREESAAPGSNRSFGLVMGGVFLILSLVKFWTGSVFGFAWLAAAVLFAGAAVLAPQVLAPLNRVWFRFGLLLHKIVNPVVMGLIFFGAMLPIGLLMRLFGQRPIPLKFDRDAKSYWVPRTVRTPPPGSMVKQY
jgi:hypothetical protein